MWVAAAALGVTIQSPWISPASFIFTTSPSVCRSPPHVVCLAQGDVIRVVADVEVKGELNTNGMTGEIVKVGGESDDGSVTVALRQPSQPGPTGYFDFRELRLIHRDLEKLAAFEASERARWLAVHDEEWIPTHQELVEGDRVEVVGNVAVKGKDARGMQGTVTDVWNECETDAACCCNELATSPVTVQLDEAPPLIGYFCEDEVERVKDEHDG